MKGLLTKDFLLIVQQKNLLALYAVLAVIMSLTVTSTFLVCYFPFVAVIVAFSTISYDSFDNGLAFLMTMPGAKKNYVAEKYLLSIIMLFGSWILSIVLQLVSLVFRGQEIVMTELLVEDTIILPILVLVSSLMIPVSLKYGAEKGRLVLFIIFAAIVLVVIGGSKLFEIISESGDYDPGILIETLNRTPGTMIAAIVCAISLLILLISMKISRGIINKQEF